jgi:hypothetical protein
MKKSAESPKIPTVPGPVMSARTLTSEKAPLITPNPKPDTITCQKNGNDKNNMILISVTRNTQAKNQNKTS